MVGGAARTTRPVVVRVMPEVPEHVANGGRAVHEHVHKEQEEVVSNDTSDDFCYEVQEPVCAARATDRLCNGLWHDAHPQAHAKPIRDERENAGDCQWMRSV